MGDFSLWYSLGIGMQKKLKNVTLKNDNISGLAQIGIFLISYFSDFWSQLPSNSSKCKKLGVFWKIQEFCSMMGTRILKVALKMTEIIDPKVGNPLKKETKSAINMILSNSNLSHVLFCN